MSGFRKESAQGNDDLPHQYAQACVLAREAEQYAGAEAPIVLLLAPSNDLN